ncbi:LPS assembly protein LptD [Ketobacter sp. MCCC 1A13808]|uniref:LPS-assembly protein LptD n=1 Tax=Ketobacter sp. MCCC 1A13808 TaxID=2602738 RepID=UPI000F26BBDF|nr:LPS assembly protein LptD [Ketobacter sp. MCCC 1A13808]MVF13094.1 LPS assembly protein LptD [Ketobacter sp. MCCC 1A13808]RLP52997.1 MAG: LPS-assembly protein LptD [Ketobacter sp.]
MNWKNNISPIEKVVVTFLLLAIATATGAATAAAEPETVNPYRYLDWVSGEEIAAMPEDQRPAHSGMCEGYYISPPSLTTAADPAHSDVQASADHFDTLPDGTNVLTGDVVLKQGSRELYSDEVKMNRATRATELNGNVKIRQPGMLILGERAKVNLNEKQLDVTDTEYVIHQIHVHGSAGRIYNPDDQILILDHSSYTTCEPNDNSWVIKAKQIKIDQSEGWGEVKGAQVQVGGVPILYLPWWTFPIDDRRQTGFLFPTIGSGQNGLDFSVPYYLNLAPNLDATLTPRFLSDRGSMMESEFRYLSENTKGDIGGGYLPDDQEFGDSRNLITWHHVGHYDKWVNKVDYTRVSDSDYFLDLDTTLNTSSTAHLNQRTDMRYYGDTWNFGGQVQSFQTIDELIPDNALPYRMLPQLSALGRFPMGDSPLEFKLGTEYTYFEHPEKIVTGPTTAERIRLIPSASYNFRRAWGFVQPKLSYYQRYYDMNQVNLTDDERNLSNGIFSVDSGLYLDRPFEMAGSRYLQTLEPRLFYLYSPYKDQNDLPTFDTAKTSFSYEQLFRENRFTGGDRVGDANQISLGLTSRLINEQTGQEEINVSIGQIFYLRDRKVQLTQNNPPEETTLSPFVARINWLIDSEWSWRAETQMDTQENNLDSIVTGFRYRAENGNLMNLSYNFYDDGAVGADPLAEKINQTDFSFIWSVSQRWGLIGRWGYDLEEQRSYDTVFGIEYESCCWRARLVNRRYLRESNDPSLVVEPSQGIYVQFELKGLGGLGGSVDTMLDDAISGYQLRENSRPSGF